MRFLPGACQYTDNNQTRTGERSTRIHAIQIFPCPQASPSQCTLEVHFTSFRTEQHTLADDKLYKAEYVGSGTFLISKPKRKKTKQRQSNLKNVRRGSRK
jgi:hypothetical protein